MRKKVSKVQEWLDTTGIRGFQDDLHDYHDDALDEASQMVGYDLELGFPKNYSSIGGRPAPLNPNQFPTLEEIDAIRHYYAPQILAEEDGGGILPGIKSVVYPGLNEMGNVLSAESWSQIKPDLYNNAIAVLDEMTGADKMPATAFKNRLKNKDGNIIPRGEFGVFAEHALDRSIVPPSFTKEDINLIHAMNTIDIIATGAHE